VAIDVVVLLDNCVDFWDERMTSEEFDDLVARSADYWDDSLHTLRLEDFQLAKAHLHAVQIHHFSGHF